METGLATIERECEAGLRNRGIHDEKWQRKDDPLPVEGKLADGRTIAEHRKLVNYSLVSRWEVRTADLKNAIVLLNEWYDQHARSFSKSDLPPCNDLFETANLESEDFCDCSLCQLKRDYQEAVRELQQVVNESEALKDIPPDLEADIQSDLEADIQPDLEADIPPEDSVSDSAEMDPLEQAKMENKDIEQRMSTKDALAYIQMRATAIETERELKRKDNELKRERFESAKRERALKIESAKRERALTIESTKRERALTIESTKREREIKLKLVAKTIFSAVDAIKHMVNDVVIIHLTTYSRILLYTNLGNNTTETYKGSQQSVDPRLGPVLTDPSPFCFETLDPAVVVETSANKKLKDFFDGLSNKLKTATLIKKDEPDFEKKIRQTQKSILVHSKLSDWPTTEIDVPFAAAVEKKGYHPLLYAFIYRIASMQTSTDSKSREAVSNLLTTERLSYVHAKQQARFIDVVIQRVHERLRAILPSTCYVAIEVKPLHRTKTNLTGLHEEGVHQVIGHLSKQIMHYFNLGGIGCDYKCRGMVLTLLSVEILEMELSDVGTELVSVKLRRTGPYYLFDKKTTEHLLEGTGIKAPEFKFDAKKPYCGLEMVDAVLRSPSVEVSPYSKLRLRYRDSADSKEERQVGILLGSGNFSFVYKLDSTAYIKIARGPGYLPGLRQEMKTLLLLHLDSICPFIPISPNSKLGIVSFRRGCEKSKVEVLAISGIVGIAASMFKSFDTTQLQQVFKNVVSALDHAHKAGICHLDVRPSNIIVKEGKEKSLLEVQLCDWGCARPMEGKRSSLKGFWGCAPFAHDEIHKKKSSDTWKPDPKHDFASLAFTMVALMGDHPNEVLWADFCGNKVNDDMLRKRREQSCKAIDKSEFAQILKDVLKGYIPKKNPEETPEAPEDGPPQQAQADNTSPQQGHTISTTSKQGQGTGTPTSEVPKASQRHIRERQLDQPETGKRKRNVAVAAKQRRRIN